MEGEKEGKKDEQRGGERDDSPAEAVQIFKASNAISAWPAGESRWTKQVSSLTHTHTHTLVSHRNWDGSKPHVAERLLLAPV